jgi:AraC-like DNA-binding protein
VVVKILLRARDEPLSSRLDYWKHILSDTLVPIELHDPSRPCHWVVSSDRFVFLLLPRVLLPIGRDQVTPDTPRGALLLKIYAFIEEHLSDPQLSPTLVARSNHLSIRYLHKLFETQSMTVAAWIRERRLERCRNDLLDPGLRAQSVSYIAARRGFPEPSHFSRVFRQAYGVPPSEYRKAFNGRGNSEAVPDRIARVASG